MATEGPCRGIGFPDPHRRRFFTVKLLSIAVPCYHSAAYMSRCINSLAAGGSDVEILIIDDGSTKDNTAQIADDYQARYPGMIRAIHQPNAGHGGAVNTGLAHATGLYFKVVDSDDWVNKKAYLKILDTLRELSKRKQTVDMFLSNYVYEKQGASHKMVMHYRGVLPQDRIFTWEEVGRFKIGKYILMHSVIYRTELLKACGLRLPEHTFYVDNIFVFQPFPYVETMYYMDLNFYRYYIGREGQSVNEDVMISRIDQQFRVNYLMIDQYTESEIRHPRCDRYMLNYLAIVTTISSILCIRSKEEKNLRRKKELWDYLREKNRPAYRKLRYNILGIVMNLPGKAGRGIASFCYVIAQKLYGFN